jgi:MoxR-like ATPase
LESSAGIRDALRQQSYIASDEIATVVFLAQQLEKPLLAEGPAGSARPSWPRPGRRPGDGA